MMLIKKYSYCIFKCISVYAHILFEDEIMNRIRWSVVVPESTDKALRTYLASRGMKKGDISHFVDEAVQLRLFELVTEKVKERNERFNQEEILSAIDEAVSTH